MEASHRKVTLGTLASTVYVMFVTGARLPWTTETFREKRNANNATATARMIARSVVICVLRRYRVSWTWWAIEDSNLWPSVCKTDALTI